VLDGDWTTGESTFARGSGNGTAGGIFNFAFHVLVGDVDGSGTTNASDLSALRQGVQSPLGTAATAATIRLNIDGNNVINAQDVSQWRQILIRPLGIVLSGLTAPTAPTEPAAEPNGRSAPQSTGLSATGLSAEAWAWFALEQEQAEAKNR